ncbi:MAG TPA: nickel-binding protein [Chryseosolibacter sp.]|nr:nickel-binding protein [Chryseosolibacter sp.]
MDLHKAEDYEVKPTMEEIKCNHIADLKTQAKYGVRFIQYWINEAAGLVFCLMEAPDKESCIATHQEAHGNMPCNVIEVKGGDYRIFMGEGRVNEFDIAEDSDGRLDPGRRSFLAADVISLSGHSSAFDRLQETSHRFSGRLVSVGNGRIKFVFNDASNAIECAVAIQRQREKIEGDGLEIRTAISTGEPVSSDQKIFEDVMNLADWLCDICADCQITISSQTIYSHIGRLPEPGGRLTFKLLKPADEIFLRDIMAALKPIVATGPVGMDKLSTAVGASKAQVYRKLTRLTGYSPNAFIHELRLRNSLQLVRREFGNVAQIAFASGFNSPSYFTKSFKKRFGKSPAQL